MALWSLFHRENKATSKNHITCSMKLFTFLCQHYSLTTCISLHQTLCLPFEEKALIVSATTRIVTTKATPIRIEFAGKFVVYVGERGQQKFNRTLKEFSNRSGVIFGQVKVVIQLLNSAYYFNSLLLEYNLIFTLNSLLLSLLIPTANLPFR